MPLDHDVLLAWLCDDREDSVSNRAIVDWLGDIFCWGLATYGLRNCSDLDDFPTEGGHFDVQDGAFPPHIASDWAVVHFRVDFLEWHWFVVFVKDLRQSLFASRSGLYRCAFDFDGALNVLGFRLRSKMYAFSGAYPSGFGTVILIFVESDCSAAKIRFLAVCVVPLSWSF